jgi:Fic family protein
LLDRTRPYNELPHLPPKGELETRDVLKRCVSARAALAELRIAGQLIPNQAVLINTIPLLEAKDSSEIENIVTTNDALFREAELNDGDGDPAAKEALRYRTALYEGLQSLKERPLTTRSAINICRTVKGINLDIRATPGTALRNSHTGEIIYTPPEGQEHLRGLLANWEAFVNGTDDLDPVVRMAVQHYQFEAIHPFPDGNGRTGRILNILILIQHDILDLPTLYLSRHILRTRPDYYRLLDGVSFNGDWQSWILYMLDAVTLTSRWTNHKIRAIRALMDHTADYVRDMRPKIYSHELVDLIFAQPYCRISNVVDRGIAKRQAAATYLKALVEIGILEEEKVGRDKLFIHRKYMTLLGAETHDFERYSNIKPSAGRD